MAISIFHNSHENEYRSPFGAQAAGASITLRLAVYGLLAPSVTLRLWQEGIGEVLLPMEPVPVQEQASQPTGGLYQASFRLPEKGTLVWYYFIIKGTEACQEEGPQANPDKPEHIWYYGNGPEKLGGAGCLYDQEPPAYQITVYNRGSVTPSWFKNALVYQIFPDRFYRAEHSSASLQGKQGAVIHSCWQDQPYYCKNQKGEVVQYDFFGGNLAGIREKLDYLADLGVTVIYLNPIFKARSNHRYDTGDYMQIDPFLGDEAELRYLCHQARAKGIRIILDGVFSHTGDDSLYFNRYGNYEGRGAYESKDSPYYSWYKFKEYPDKYESWWGVDALPEVEETNPGYMDYIINNPDSVLNHWLKAGISGWRLDVADELPPRFLQSFWQALKEQNRDAVLIGEVWEDASNKISYGEQRAYLSGGKLDGVMNYVLRGLMLDFVQGSAKAEEIGARLWQLFENYPPENLYAMLNVLGTHDVERVLTLLQGDRAKLQQLWAWQMTFPGAPSIYYGDEVGALGGKDPDNRRTYPWDNRDEELYSSCRSLARLRGSHAALRTGSYLPLRTEDSVLAYGRQIEGARDAFGEAAEDGLFIVALNSSPEARSFTLYTDGLAYGQLQVVYTAGREPGPLAVGATVAAEDGNISLTLPPQGAIILQAGEAQGPKRAGVLLHPTSLPFSQAEKEAAAKAGLSLTDPLGPRNILPAAKEFIELLQASGQGLWQMLPLTPPGEGNSPYLALSAFAGNEEYFALRPREAAPEPGRLQQYYRQQAYWLEDYALYRALKDYFKGQPWYSWPEAIKGRAPEALKKYKSLLAEQVQAYRLGQYYFNEGWQQIKAYAQEKGVRLLGDMPIFVAWDSADCWAHQELFQLDDQGNPQQVAGVPPDYFSKTGQKWGNPLYDWDKIAATNYEWWVQRFSTLAGLVDEIRIDHFRGFESYWAVAAEAETAMEGVWRPGPGAKLFQVVQQRLPHLRLVAEDLGVITPEVSRLKNQLGLPGMRILQFHLKNRGMGRLEFTTEPNCLAYTGTHDNNTTAGWYREDLTAAEGLELKQLLQQRGMYSLEAETTEAKADTRAVVKGLIEYLYSRRAQTVAVPMQDVLALGADCRMNVPGTPRGNWNWQLQPGQMAMVDSKWLLGLAKKYQRY